MSTKKVNPYARHKARKLAVQALYQWQISQSHPTEILTQYRQDQDFKKVDAEYFEELFQNITQSCDELDEKFKPYLDRKFEELDPIELAILRLSTYELLKRIDIPYKVVINESIELAKVFGANESHKYVNGVVDKTAQDLRKMEMK